jgi:prepilin-type processing-associated H-X9-DG protein
LADASCREVYATRAPASLRNQNKWINSAFPYHCPADILPDARVTPANTIRVRTYSMSSYMNSDNEMWSSHGPNTSPNPYTINKKSSDIKHPAAVGAIVFTEEVQWSIDDGQFADVPSGLPAAAAYNSWWNIPQMNHRGSDFSFADGHVEYRKWVDGSTLSLANYTGTGGPYTDNSTDHSDLRWVQNGMATQ